MLQRCIKSLVLGLWGLGLTSCGETGTDEAQYSRVHSDSGYRGPAYEKLLSSLDQAQKEQAESIEVIRYGRSVEGRDLALVRIADPKVSSKAVEPRPAVLITQAIHGNEYQQIADRIVLDFSSGAKTFAGLHDFLDEGGIVYIVPVVNPDGYERRQRENRQGYDLNRDWPSTYNQVDGFKGPETKALAEFVKADLKKWGAILKLSFDYHCCSLNSGSTLFLHPWGTSKDLRDGTIPEEDIGRFEGVNDIFQGYFKGAKFGTPYQTVRYTAKGSLMDYFYEEQGALAFSFEGVYKQEHLNFDRHAEFWDKILTITGKDQVF